MIEDSALLLICLFFGVPILIGAVWAFMTRPDKYYYKSTYGGRWKKIPIHTGRRKGK